MKVGTRRGRKTDGVSVTLADNGLITVTSVSVRHCNSAVAISFVNNACSLTYYDNYLLLGTLAPQFHTHSMIHI